MQTHLLKEDWPDKFTMDCSVYVDTQKDNANTGTRLLFYFNGSKEEFDRTIRNSIPHKVHQKQIIRRTIAEKSSRFLHESLGMFNTLTKSLHENLQSLS